MQAPWPGNVRELRNAIEHAFVTISGSTITLLDLPSEVRSSSRPADRSPAAKTAPLSPAIDLTPQQLAEREKILEALEATGGNKTEAAKLLGTSRVTLWKKIRRYGIESA